MSDVPPTQPRLDVDLLGIAVKTGIAGNNSSTKSKKEQRRQRSDTHHSPRWLAKHGKTELGKNGEDRRKAEAEEFLACKLKNLTRRAQGSQTKVGEAETCHTGSAA